LKAKHNTTVEPKLASSPAYVVQRVRRAVPHESKLVPALKAFWDRWSQYSYPGTE
jgi:hypothetical protein